MQEDSAILSSVFLYTSGLEVAYFVPREHTLRRSRDAAWRNLIYIGPVCALRLSAGIPSSVYVAIVLVLFLVRSVSSRSFVKF